MWTNVGRFHPEMVGLKNKNVLFSWTLKNLQQSSTKTASLAEEWNIFFAIYLSKEDSFFQNKLIDELRKFRMRINGIEELQFSCICKRGFP